MWGDQVTVSDTFSIKKRLWRFVDLIGPQGIYEFIIKTGDIRMRFITNTSLIFSILLIAGCADSSVDERGDRVAVSGKVTLDGQPLSRARIIFVSDQGKGKVKSSALIEDGAFSITKENGPLPGSARVEIHPELAELEEFEGERAGDETTFVDTKRVDIPAEYNFRSKLTADVGNEDSNAFTFDLKTTP